MKLNILAATLIFLASLNLIATKNTLSCNDSTTSIVIAASNTHNINLNGRRM